MSTKMMPHHLAPNKLFNRFLSYHDSYHCAIDIETEYLDFKEPGVVLSVGMVTIGPEHYSHVYFTIDREESLALGMKSDPKVVEWLNTLPKPVRDAAYANPVSVDEALDIIEEYVAKVLQDTGCQMLNFIGNAPEFDQGFLDWYFKAKGRKTPFLHWMNRDFRTLASLQLISFDDRRMIKEELRSQHESMSDHHALFDAMLEAKTWVRTINRVKELQDLEHEVNTMIAMQGNSVEDGE